MGARLCTPSDSGSGGGLLCGSDLCSPDQTDISVFKHLLKETGKRNIEKYSDPVFLKEYDHAVKVFIDKGDNSLLTKIQKQDNDEMTLALRGCVGDIFDYFDFDSSGNLDDDECQRVLFGYLKALQLWMPSYMESLLAQRMIMASGGKMRLKDSLSYIRADETIKESLARSEAQLAEQIEEMTSRSADIFDLFDVDEDGNVSKEEFLDSFFDSFSHICNIENVLQAGHH